MRQSATAADLPAWTTTRTSCPSDRTLLRCLRRRGVPARGRVEPQSRSRVPRRSSHRRHRRWLAPCLPRAESSHGAVRCTRSPAAEKAMVPGGGAGDHPSTRQGITHLSGNSGDCSGHRSGSTDRYQTGGARATVRRKDSRQSVLDRHEIAHARRPRIRERTVGVDLDHRHAGVLIDVFDGEHARAACADLHPDRRASWWFCLRSTRQNGTCRFPSSNHNLAKLIFWTLGRPVCDPAGSLTSRVGPWLLLRLSRRPPHPGEQRPRMRRNEDLRLADDAQISAVSGRSRGAQRRRAGARCPAHDHPVRSQSAFRHRFGARS